jgi:hypothetical protein
MLRTHLIVITTNDVHVCCNGPQIVVRFTVANIASAEDLLDFSWNEKFLELGGQVVGSMGDMKVTDDEDEDHGWCGLTDEARERSLPKKVSCLGTNQSWLTASKSVARR